MKAISEGLGPDPRIQGAAPVASADCDRWRRSWLSQDSKIKWSNEWNGGGGGSGAVRKLDDELYLAQRGSHLMNSVLLGKCP